MLKHPHTRYNRIYTYHIEGIGFPAINDPDLIGIWEEDGKTILIFHSSKDLLVQELCRRNSCLLFYQADLDYDDWEMGRAVIPFKVGPLKVVPIWDSQPADIKIDPSVVFGNGFHPSTRLCLEALVSYYSGFPKGFTGLDLGCGTGLLGIAAAKLGASSVTAIDHNPLACSVTRQNAALNKVENSILVKQADLRSEVPSTETDVLMANLHHELLAALFRDRSFWQAGIYILSGFMSSEEELLLASLPDPPPPLLERRRLDKWRIWVLGNI